MWTFWQVLGRNIADNNNNNYNDRSFSYAHVKLFRKLTIWFRNSTAFWHIQYQNFCICVDTWLLTVCNKWTKTFEPNIHTQKYSRILSISFCTCITNIQPHQRVFRISLLIKREINVEQCICTEMTLKYFHTMMMIVNWAYIKFLSRRVFSFVPPLVLYVEVEVKMKNSFD